MLACKNQPDARRTSPDPAPVALLSIPSLAETNCGRLQLDAFAPLTEPELRDLLGALSTQDRTKHARIRRKGDRPQELGVFLEERFGIDVLTDDEKTQLVEDVDEPQDPPPAAFLHVDVNLFDTGEGSRLLPRTDDQDIVGRLWDWSAMHPIEAHVRTWMMFDAMERRSIINLPLPVPGDITAFDAVQGLWLVKREKPGADEPVLYEVSLRQESDTLSLFVHFRASLDGSPDMLAGLLSRAQQIASFATPESQPMKLPQA